MGRDFQQLDWDEVLADDCRQVIRLAVREDLEREQDWTTVALVSPDRVGSADIVARQPGIVAGMPALATALDEMGVDLKLDAAAADRQAVRCGDRLGTLTGSVRDLLTCERIVLNLLGRLMGIATLTAEYAEAISGTSCRIYDTRKTTPGWRRLEKYAVRCGGGCNHRTGLFDAILIKDNHLAQFADGGLSGAEVAAAAVRQVRRVLAEAAAAAGAPAPAGTGTGISLTDLLIEVEVDRLDQLRAVLPERPDIVLLDNMSLVDLREAVALRRQLAPSVEFEASGGVTLATVRQIAETGVERISVGALTHGAKSLDVGLDWHDHSPVN